MAVKMWFTDANGESLSETTDVTLSAEQTTKVTFTLHDRASSLKECRLIISGVEQAPDEALLMLSFSIKIAFGVDFGF